MNTLLPTRIFSISSSWVPMVSRVPVSSILVTQGTRRLFDWSGGYGLVATSQWTGTIGTHLGRWVSLHAVGAKCFDGAAIFVDHLVCKDVAMLTIATLVAMPSAHSYAWPFLARNGYKHALVLFALTIAIFSGVGSFLIDSELAARRKGGDRT